MEIFRKFYNTSAGVLSGMLGGAELLKSDRGNYMVLALMKCSLGTNTI